MEHTRQCRCLEALLFSLLCAPLAVVGIRQDAAEEDLPLHLAEMVARGNNVAEFSADVERNARLHADQLQSFAELSPGSNITATLGGGGGGYTPPCPWKADLNNDGQVVGSGSFGEVFTATVKCESFPVAIKKLKGSTKKNVLNEAQIMDRFSSPNFIRIYGMGKSTKPGSNVYYLLMEAARGGSYESYVKKSGKNLGNYQVAVNLFMDALEGLVEMHRRGYHHRDIKPANILVTAPCLLESCQGKLADLGESCEATTCKDLHGTPYYMAPELLKYEINSRRNDVWSMGIILFRILNKGKYPKEFLESPTSNALYSIIKKYNVVDKKEYQQMPNSGLKVLLAKMLDPNVQTRVGSDAALDLALRAWRNCGIFPESGEVCPAESRVAQLLPSCWGGSSKGDWQPKSDIKKDDAPKQAPKQVKKVVEVVEQPAIEYRELPEMPVEKDAERGQANTHVKEFLPGKLGVNVIEATGAVEIVSDGQMQDAGVQEGWFIDQVCGQPYSWQLLIDALNGRCNTNPYTIVFREPLVPQVALPEDDEGMQMQTQQHQEGTVKVFVINSPKSNVGVGYIFSHQKLVSEQGVVQQGWAKLNTRYTREMGIPLKPGDEILRVNNEKWSEIVDDRQFKFDAASGKLGPLTILYLTD